MTEIRNIIQRLRAGQSKRQIHRDLKVHRSIIRKLNDLAISQRWLNIETPMPSDEEIAMVWDKKRLGGAVHPLDPYKEQIQHWHQQGLSSVVIHRLLQDSLLDLEINPLASFLAGIAASLVLGMPIKFLFGIMRL